MVAIEVVVECTGARIANDDHCAQPMIDVAFNVKFPLERFLEAISADLDARDVILPGMLARASRTSDATVAERVRPQAAAFAPIPLDEAVSSVAPTVFPWRLPVTSMSLGECEQTTHNDASASGPCPAVEVKDSLKDVTLLNELAVRVEEHLGGPVTFEVAHRGSTVRARVVGEEAVGDGASEVHAQIRCLSKILNEECPRLSKSKPSATKCASVKTRKREKHVEYCKRRIEEAREEFVELRACPGPTSRGGSDESCPAEDDIAARRHDLVETEIAETQDHHDCSMPGINTQAQLGSNFGPEALEGTCQLLPRREVERRGSEPPSTGEGETAGHDEPRHKRTRRAVVGDPLRSTRGRSAPLERPLV